MPVEAYQESIQKCIEQKTDIPQWYTVLDDKENFMKNVVGIFFTTVNDDEGNSIRMYVASTL
ncbi:hypothetical protein [Paraclostridium sordellii]|uniref:hypothetical protein n=1 Tax=Paraclostridium sordellii TaxID=1505 RepID=UPI0006DBEF56|nr:hypothetical protein [Paeniclostridium sordellii]